MKAISIQQPWAWLIVQGFKDVENRTRKTNFRGEILVHASKHKPTYVQWKIFKEAFRMEWYGKIKLPDFEQMYFGGIIGKTEIIDCVSNSNSQWFEGPYGYILSNSKPLPFIPCKGQVTIPFIIDINLDGE